MLRDIAAKTLRDQGRALAGWTVAIVLLVAMYVAIWPSMRDQPAMSDFLDQMPEAFRSLFAATGADMSTPLGYLQIELMSFMAPILVILYAVTAGSAAVAGEEGKRTLDLLVTAPVSRRRIVVEKAVAMVVGTFGLSALLGVSLVVEGRFADMDLPTAEVAAAMLHLAFLGLVFGAMALAIGCLTGQAGLSKAVPAVVAVVTYVVNGLGGMVTWLEPLQRYSPFFQFSGHDPLRNGISWPAVAVAFVTVAVLVVLAVVGFERRDVRS
ncbi:MAG TPA: ABC transporter permease subunit [Humibacillus sp.]|nr:ABC transporter permease subunit [Humibacillus sp.]